jgi:tetratricopeptide (TPR) repeat protein
MRTAGLLTACGLLLLPACRQNPLEEPSRLIAAGRCAEADPPLAEISLRDDGWGRAARVLRARCAVKVLEASDDVEAWGEAVSGLRRVMVDLEGSTLEGGVAPLSGEELGRAAMRLMTLHLSGGEHEQVLAVALENGARAAFPPGARELTGMARLHTGGWARAAADLDAAAGTCDGAEKRADLLRLASGAWHLAGQQEKALVDFSRAEKTHSLDWQYPERLIPEGQEMEHVLGELIAAAVHGVLTQEFTRDWETLEADPKKLNFFIAEKRSKSLLEAEEEVETLRHVIAAGGTDQHVEAAPWLLYQILNMRGLFRAAGGDYAGARIDLKKALDLDPEGQEALSNLALLGFWIFDPVSGKTSQ